MSKHSYDLIVLGTGPAAGTVAKKIAEDGKSVAVVEAREFGGTCALRGCNPKKVYTNAGDLVDRARQADGKLGSFDNPSINWSALLSFKREFTEPVVEKSEASFQRRGIDTYHGTASFSGRNRIEVDGRILEADRIFIGTGGSPAKLNFDGEKHLTLSDEFLELADLPEHVTFVGGGYISMEFAHVVARYGRKVTVVDNNSRPLQHFDPDLVDQLVDWSRQKGIDFVLDAMVTGITKPDTGGFRVAYDQNGKSGTIETNLVVHGAGRTPNIAELNLSTGDVESSKKGIVVDKFMRSVSNPHVFGAGDCAASDLPRLTTVANEQARIVVKNLFADSISHEPDYGVVPAVVFTSPCIASVGMSESEARDKVSDCDVRHEDTSQWGTSRKYAQPCSAYKLLVDKSNDRIVGAHLLGPSAEETINLFAFAMKFGHTATDIKSTLFAFPTFASDVRRMV